jgi:hypothetical protein
MFNNNSSFKKTRDPEKNKCLTIPSIYLKRSHVENCADFISDIKVANGANEL